MTRQEEIKELIEAFGIKKTFIADKLGITRQVLSYQLNEAKDLDYEYYFKIKELLRGIIPEKEISPKLSNEFKIGEFNLNEFPLITKVYAGSSAAMFLHDNISEYISFPYPKKDRCFAVEVTGDSMNHRIEPGDIVLVDMDKEVTTNCIVVARLKDGRQLIKRYKELDNNFVMFHSDNGNYEPVTVLKQEIEAIYRVVRIWKKVP